MEKKMETTICLKGLGFYMDNGKENGNYYIIQGSDWFRDFGFTGLSLRDFGFRGLSFRGFGCRFRVCGLGFSGLDLIRVWGSGARPQRGLRQLRGKQVDALGPAVLCGYLGRVDLRHACRGRAGGQLLPEEEAHSLGFRV